MDDVTKTKYAEFLESMIEMVMRHYPDSIAVNMILPDHAIISGYFECCTNNKLTIAASLFRDAVQESIEEKEEKNMGIFIPDMKMPKDGDCKELGFEKILGKIDFAEFGTFRDRPFLMGLQLGFAFPHGGVMDGGKYTVNISDQCRWSEEERQEAITELAEFLRDILKDAKCNYVSELIGKPVEVTLRNNTFVWFRILTEVL